MKKIVVGLIIGFGLGVVSAPYLKLNIHLLRDKRGVLFIENCFLYNNQNRKFDKVLLQIKKNRGSNVQLSTYNIPQTSRKYYLKVERNNLNEANTFTWLIYARGILHRIPCKPVYVSPDTVRISELGSINDVRVTSQEPRLVSDEKAVHSVVVHNYNKRAVIPKLLVTYFSPQGNTVYDTLIRSSSEIPPEDNKRILLQVKSNKIERAESSTVTVVEVDHVRP